MIKIRVSYKDPEELQRVLGLLSPIVIRHKEVSGKEGQLKKSYIEADFSNQQRGETMNEPRGNRGKTQKCGREIRSEKS